MTTAGEGGAERVRHVANGDATAITLRAAGLPGVVVNWADALYDGPVPGAVSDAERVDLRARFWSATGLVPYADARAVAESWERDLRSYEEHDEIVIWCEHDVYDQLLLLHHLHVFSQAAPPPRVVSLVMIDRFPGAGRFIGLGQLSAEQLASLYPARRPVSREAFALGEAGWRAFTGEDPRAVEAFLARDTSALPFLAPALRRMLEEYPAVGNGLPRTERMLLERLGHGPMTFRELFTAHQRAEPAPFYGDTSVWMRLRSLAAGPRALIAMDVDGPEPVGAARIARTDDGRRVVGGDADWLALQPFDRWIGGVHLAGRNAWRWNADQRRLALGAVL